MGVIISRSQGESPVSPGAKRGSESQTKEYRAWRNVNSRCHNPRDIAFAYYGGRGISMCDRWRKNYRAFLKDIGRAPSPKHQLGRIDNDGNYEPGNIEWQTPRQQATNRRPRTAHLPGCQDKSHRARVCGLPVVVRGRMGRPRSLTAEQATIAARVIALSNGKPGVLRKLAEEYGVSGPTVAAAVKRVEALS